MSECSKQVSGIALVARRQHDLDQGHLDYHVYAGSQLVGRIYEIAPGHWRWAINSVMFDATTDIQGAGYAASLEDAQSCLRPVFERWLAWALAVPASDLKYGPLDRNLKAIGVR
jgi:hypothetical protein